MVGVEAGVMAGVMGQFIGIQTAGVGIGRRVDHLPASTMGREYDLHAASLEVAQSGSQIFLLSRWESGSRIFLLSRWQSGSRFSLLSQWI